MLKNNRAFTLIEMLVVLMIISVLIILVVPNLSGKSKEVNEKGCDALVQVVQSQSDAYFLDNGDYATDIDTLVSDGYITEDQLICPNNEALKYSNGQVTGSGN